MKLQVVGIELSEGVSHKTGSAKEYSIGQLHAMAPLAPPMKEGNIAKGFMGTTYRCDANLLRKCAHLPVPFVAEVTIQDVMRFGKREQEVQDIQPVETVRQAAPVSPAKAS